MLFCESVTLFVFYECQFWKLGLTCNLGYRKGEQKLVYTEQSWVCICKQVKFIKNIEGTSDAVPTRVAFSFNFYLFLFLAFVCIILCRFFLFYDYIYIVFIGKGLFQCFPSTGEVQQLIFQLFLFFFLWFLTGEGRDILLAQKACDSI